MSHPIPRKFQRRTFRKLVPQLSRRLALVQIFVLQHWCLVRRARDGSNGTVELSRDGGDDDKDNDGVDDEDEEAQKVLHHETRRNPRN